MTTLLLLGLGVTFVSAGVPQRISQRGWAPLVRLVGAGNTTRAVGSLHGVVGTVGAALHRLDVDRPTLDFAEQLGESLSDFDLAEFHDSLPERDGTWQRIRVIGELRGKAYVVRQLTPRQPTPRVKKAGDLRVTVRTKQTGDNYLFRGRLAMGVGHVGWNDIQAGLAVAARLAASGDPHSSGYRREQPLRPGPTTRIKLLKSHPGLRPEDIEVLAVLWESFPALGDGFHSIARAENVAVFDVHGDGSYQQLRLEARLVPELLEDRYPELAEFLEDLENLARIQVVWFDEQRRELARLSVNTKDLRLSFACFVKDGELLAVENGKVVATRSPPGQRRILAVIDVRTEVSGIKSHISNLRMNWTYSQHSQGADLRASITTPPKVTTSGRAFGWIPVPTGLMQDLIEEFLATACRGNDGHGIVLGLSVLNRNGQGSVRVGAGLEVLDSQLIQIGMRLASLKLLPSADVRSELHALLVQLHRAFEHDLRRFARLCSR